MGKATKQNIYGFTPSVAACVVFIVLFGILAVYHFYVMIKRKCWYWWPFALGVAFEVIGYIARIPSGRHPGSVGLYAIQTLFILLPPAMFAASIYMTLGRMLVYIKAEQASLVSVRWMTGFFVTGDVVSFLLQGGGGGLESSSKTQHIGSAVAIGGLGVQLVFFGGFVVTSAIVDRRLRSRNYNPMTPGKYHWRTLFKMLYVASVLILIRSVFRVVEFAQGYSGFTMQHEIFMYLFDAMLMFFVCVTFSIVHPAFVLIPGGEIQDSTYELKPARDNDEIPLSDHEAEISHSM